MHGNSLSRALHGKAVSTCERREREKKENHKGSVDTSTSKNRGDAVSIQKLSRNAIVEEMAFCRAEFKYEPKEALPTSHACSAMMENAFPGILQRKSSETERYGVLLSCIQEAVFCLMDA